MTAPEGLTDRHVAETALFLYRVAFDKQARATGGTVSWVSQHGLIYSWIKNYGLSEAKADGLCAGLAIDWLKARATGGDLVTILRNQQLAVFHEPPASRVAIETFAQALVESHNGQRDVEDALETFLRPGVKKSFDYPYAKIEGAFEKGTYFYISTAGHSMAAVTDDAGRMTFYDPNVGEVSGTSAKFFGPYQRACVEATATAKRAYPTPGVVKVAVAPKGIGAKTVDRGVVLTKDRLTFGVRRSQRWVHQQQSQ